MTMISAVCRWPLNGQLTTFTRKAHLLSKITRISIYMYRRAISIGTVSVYFCGLLHPPAAGLYYLAELIEEYSVLAKKILTYLLIVS